MDRILFKGKAENGEWVEGYLIKGVRTYIATKEAIENMVVSISGRAGLELIEVIPETVRQFTGLTDDNGEKIFDGDIIQGNIGSAWSKRLIRCEVIFKDGCFLSAEKDSYSRTWYHRVKFSRDIEVIGNIHDNPKLLKVV